MRFQLNAAFLAPILIFAVSSCGGDAVTGPPSDPVPGEPWSVLSTGVFETCRPYLAGGALYVAAGAQGCLRRHPAWEGDWSRVGSGFEDADTGLPGLSGVRALAWSGSRMYAGVADAHGRPGIYRIDSGEADWTPLPASAEVTLLTDLIAPGEGTLLASSMDGGVLLSGDGGAGWTRVYGSQDSWVQESRLYACGNAVYHGGRSAFYTPYLFRSGDGGATWSWIHLSKLLGVTADGSVTGIASAAADPERVYLGINRKVFVSTDGMQTVKEVLAARADTRVLVNPSQPMEVLVTADSLCWTRDGGATWRAFGPPEEYVRMGQAAVDWAARRVVVPVWIAPPEADSRNLVLYRLDLDSLQD